ncbi:tetratricopeptide repeat protein [Reichenbachiella sp. MALMAid0571]|uniref:tetratricopeptide repeat protein n=1 Tax=Reichenbachiella sp. MALMAid0571 TaxID=3143939 RepID=UPI0032DF2C8A
MCLDTNCFSQTSPQTFSNRIEQYKKATDYYNLGLRFQQKREFEKSIKYYDSAISLNVRNVDYYLARAESRESSGNPVAALADYETVILIDPEYPSSYFKRGLIYHQQKNYKAAIADFTLLLEGEQFKVTKGIIFKGVQQNEGGLATFSGITTMNQMKSDVFNARALSYVQLNETDKALLDFENAIKENSNDPNYFVNRGLLKLSLQDTVIAKADFISALEIKPGFKPAIYNLSKISTEKERDGLKKELYADNESSVIFSQMAYEKFLSGEYKKALLYYDSALFWMPKNADDLMNRGIVKLKLKQTKSAIRDFDKSIALDKSLIRNYFLIGNAYQTLKAYEEGIKYYEFYLATAGADAQVHYNKGIAELQLGNKDQACKDLTLALNMGEKKAAKPKEEACK